MKYLLNLFFLGFITVSVGCGYARQQITDILNDMPPPWFLKKTDQKQSSISLKNEPKLSVSERLASEESAKKLELINKKLDELEQKIAQIEKRIRVALKKQIRSKNNSKKKKKQTSSKPKLKKKSKKKSIRPRLKKTIAYRKPEKLSKIEFWKIPQGKDSLSDIHAYRIYMGAFLHHKNAKQRVESILKLQMPALIISNPDKEKLKSSPLPLPKQKRDRQDYADFNFLSHHVQNVQKMEVLPPTPNKKSLYFVVSKQFYSYPQGRQITQLLTHSGYECYLKKVL